MNLTHSSGTKKQLGLFAGLTLIWVSKIFRGLKFRGQFRGLEFRGIICKKQYFVIVSFFILIL